MHTTTTLLALTGATLALANPAPAPLVTPAPMLHPVAARLAARQLDDDPTFSKLNTIDLSKSLECGRQYASLANEVPRESNSALATWLLTAAAQNVITAAETIDNSLTTLCDPSVTATLTPPASLSSAWSTYQSKATSWVSSAAPAAHSIASSCGGQISAAVELLVISDSESCTTAVLGMVAALNGDEGATSAAGTTGSPSQTTGAGASETGAGVSETGSAGVDGGSQGGAGASGETGATGAGATQTTSTSTGGVPRETGMMGVVAAAAVAVAGVVAAL